MGVIADLAFAPKRNHELRIQAMARFGEQRKDALAVGASCPE